MTTDEMRERQKKLLFSLLLIEKSNPDLKIKNLRLQLAEARVGMNKEDIADVEKEIAELLAEEF